jgi:hypothetical protein
MEDEIKLVAYDPMVLVKYMDEYFNTKTPDCSFYSEDGHEIPVHCEVLYQTKWVVYFNSENCRYYFISEFSIFDVSFFTRNGMNTYL